MSKSIRKSFAIVLTLALLFSFVIPVFDGTAEAASTNSIDRVLSVSKDKDFNGLANVPVLQIKNKDNTFSANEMFRVELPANAKWNTGAWGIDGVAGAIYNPVVIDPSNNGSVLVNVVTERVIEVTLTNCTDKDAAVAIPMNVKFTNMPDGEVKVTVDPRDSAVSAGSYTFAVIGAGKTVASIGKVNTFARQGVIDTIQIDETRVDAIGDTAQDITLKLPPKFTWAVYPTVSTSGGFNLNDANFAKAGLNTRTLTLTFTPNSPRGTRGTIYLDDIEIRADRDAPKGEVEVDVDGTNITPATLVVGNYADYDIDITVAEVKEIVAGRMDSDNNKTAKITIQENIPGSLIAGREVYVTLPEWVKPIAGVGAGNGVRVIAATGGLAAGDVQRATRQNEFYFVVNNNIDDSVKSKYEFELILSVEADKSGDIVAEFSGAGVEPQEVVIAKAVAPVTVEVAAADLRIGVQNQPAADIVIKETKRGMLDDNNDLEINLLNGITFSKLPKVEVTEGNAEIGVPSINGGLLTIPIDSSSTKPSTIVVSGIEVTVDRSVPEGVFNADVRGGSLIKNYLQNASITDTDDFNKNRVVRFHFATVITPAPGEKRSTTTFTIDSTTYTVVEAGVAVEKTMDVAPYIKNGRTYLPVRFVADALGVSEDNIVWDPVKASVTIFKGDRIAQMTIGSNVLTVNGVELTMDAVPEITDGRTMLPVRWVAQALGATIDWDAETQTVTVKQ